jgi:hypothetical protein
LVFGSGIVERSMASNQGPSRLDPASVLGICEKLETMLDKIVESALQQVVELVCAALDISSMAGVTFLDPSGPHTVAGGQRGDGARRRHPVQSGKRRLARRVHETR